MMMRGLFRFRKRSVCNYLSLVYILRREVGAIDEVK